MSDRAKAPHGKPVEAKVTPPAKDQKPLEVPAADAAGREYLTPEQVGEALSLHRNTVYALLAQYGRGDPAGLRGKRVTVRKWIIHRDWLRAYVEAGGPLPPDQESPQ